MTEKKLAEKVFDNMMAKDHCSQWMGISPVQIDEKHCIIRMKVKQEMLNGYGILHGGIAFAFADSAFAFASNSSGRIAVSINGSMQYYKAAKEGEVLYAEAKVLHESNKIANYQAEIRNEAGEVYYHFTGMVYRTSKRVVD